MRWLKLARPVGFLLSRGYSLNAMRCKNNGADIHHHLLSDCQGWARTLFSPVVLMR